LERNTQDIYGDIKEDKKIGGITVPCDLCLPHSVAATAKYSVKTNLSDIQ
jgi:hypothetical protein